MDEGEHFGVEVSSELQLRRTNSSRDTVSRTGSIACNTYSATLTTLYVSFFYSNKVNELTLAFVRILCFCVLDDSKSFSEETNAVSNQTIR